MIRYLIISAFLLFLSCNFEKKSLSHENEHQDLNTGIRKTEIEFKEEVHDMGKIVSGEVVVYNFVYTNTGENNFNIEKIESDCGCIEVKYSEKPLIPGDMGKIEIRFDSSGLFGKQFKSIEIHANTEELKHLAIFAEVRNKQIEIKY